MFCTLRSLCFYHPTHLFQYKLRHLENATLQHILYTLYSLCFPHNFKSLFWEQAAGRKDQNLGTRVTFREDVRQ